MPPPFFFMSVTMIDLRSDTVTMPPPAMRDVMSKAPLGDDGFGEDPTVNLLESRAAEMLGKEAALFVPSGTMGNLLAAMTHMQPGDEMICGRGMHTYAAEGGGAARVAGVSSWLIPQQDARIDPADVEAAIRPDRPTCPRTALLWLEQPHLGWVMPLDNLEEVVAAARRHRLSVHMDGARVFNASVALGVPAREIARHADTVMFCLSKGLAAPVGSLLVGPEPFVQRARRNRRVIGGGMRQAGVIAAAGLFALDHMIERLADDHRHARALAAGLRKLGWRLDRESPETNMFFAEPPESLKKLDLTTRLTQHGVLIFVPTGSRTFRIVTHYGIESADVDRALDAFAALTDRQVASPISSVMSE
jgi:threonine aldolase